MAIDPFKHPPCKRGRNYFLIACKLSTAFVLSPFLNTYYCRSLKNINHEDKL